MKFVLQFTGAKSRHGTYLHRFDPAGKGRVAKYYWTHDISQAKMFDDVHTAEQYARVHRLTCAVVPYKNDLNDSYDRAMQGI